MICCLARPAVNKFGALFLMVATICFAQPSQSRAEIDFQWRSIFPIDGNHYGWGYTDGDSHSNWTTKSTVGTPYPYPFAGDQAQLTDALTIDEYIDLYTADDEGTHADSYDLQDLIIDAGPDGRRYTIEQYNGGGNLTFGPSIEGGSLSSEIIVRNDAGNDVIASPVNIVLGSLTVTGNKLLISGQINASNPGTQLVVDNCLLTLSGNNADSFPSGDKPLGSIVLTSGVLFVSDSTNLGDATTILDFQGGTLHPTASFTVGQSVTIESAGNIVVDPGVRLTLGAAVTAAGNLNVSGGGTLVLATSNAYTGNIIVNDSSSLAVANNVALSSAAATVNFDVATLTATSSTFGDAYAINAHISLAPTGGFLSGGGAVFDIPANPSVTVNGPIDGNGPITKIGAGTLVLAGNNDFTGGITVNAGTLQITSYSPTAITTNGSATFGGPAAQTVFSGSSSANGATITTNGGITFGRFGGTTIFRDSSSVGSSTITTNGGTNNGAGGVTEFAGSAYGGTARIITNAGGTFDISQLNVAAVVGSIEGAGNYRLGGGTLTFGSRGTNTVVSGEISDGGILNVAGGSIVKVGAGTTVFSGITSYTGTTTVNAGTLAISGAAFASSSAVAAPGAALTFVNGAAAGHGFLTASGGPSGFPGSAIEFFDQSTADHAHVTIMNGAGAAGVLTFHGSSSADHATFLTGSFFGNTSAVVQFYDSATAGSGAFVTCGGVGNPGGISNGAVTQFHNVSTAAAGSFTNNGAESDGGAGGQTDFYDTSDAGDQATIVNDGATYNGNGGTTQFFGASRANAAHFTNNGATIATGGDNGGGYTIFNAGTSADHATFTNEGSSFNTSSRTSGHTIFNGGSTADHGTFITDGSPTSSGVAGEIDFFDGATAANGVFTNNPGAVSGASGSLANFSRGGSSGGSATITNFGGTVSGAMGAVTTFRENSTVGSATVIANGGTAPSAGGATIGLFGNPDPSTSTLIANGGTNGGTGGLILLVDSPGSGQFFSDSLARIVANVGGTFDSSGASRPLSVGSIEGGGKFLLGGGTLITGSLNTDTNVGGVIADGGSQNNGSASLTKVGTGKLTLSGTNTYTGQTTVNGGSLAIDGAIPGAVTVNSGATLNGVGSVGGNVTVATGGILAPGNSVGTLTVGSLSLTSATTGSNVNIELAGTPSTQYDQIHVVGQLSLAGTLSVSLLNGFQPLAGTSFDILNWGSLGGTFSVTKLPTLTTGTWNTTQLYTSGLISVSGGLAGDYNGNGVVDADDYVLWRDSLGSTTNLIADGDASGKVDSGDFDVWRTNFGNHSGPSTVASSRSTAVPEPSTIALFILSVTGPCLRYRRAAQ